MKSFRKLSLLLLAVLLVLSMVACGGETATVETKVTVEAYDMAGDPILLGEVVVEAENPTVLNALEAMCAAREVALVANQFGLVEKIGEVGTSTYVDKDTGLNMAIGWTWTLNGVEVEGFANETAIKAGDKIVYTQYTYVNEEETWIDPDAETTASE